MKIGQKSFIVFATKLVGSVFGFLTTIYFARVLGSTVLGYFAVTMALVSWLKFGGNIGISSAVTKRVSEDNEWPAYATAGLIVMMVTGLLFSVVILLLNERVEQYVGASVAIFVVAIFLTQLFYNIVTSIINGRRRVHIPGILSAIMTVFTSGLQFFLVINGMGLDGLLIGQWFGWLLVLTIGLYVSNIEFSIPKRRHFHSLWQYARYSWLGALKSRSFNDVDILILGIFVPSSLIGVYSVAWSISKFLSLFDGAISQTLAPEISYLDSNADPDAVSQLVTESIRFAGLILIPGFVGAQLLGDRLLQIYGPDFQQGTAVLGFLILATMLYGYQKQLLTGINAIDRPDVAFQINVVFIGFNIVANVILISTIGFVGAAIATAMSALIGLSLSLYSLRRMVDFDIPYRDVGTQISATAVMAVFVQALIVLEKSYQILDHNLTVVFITVLSGVLIYVLTLWIISSQFRKTVTRNVPFRLPLIK